MGYFPIKNLKCNSAPGIDAIPPKFVKMAKIFLTWGIFPDGLRLYSQVIPIPKTAAPKELGRF